MSVQAQQEESLTVVHASPQNAVVVDMHTPTGGTAPPQADANVAQKVAVLLNITKEPHTPVGVRCCTPPRDACCRFVVIGW